MSKIGNKFIKIPENVKIETKKNFIKIIGPIGYLSLYTKNVDILIKRYY